MTDNELLLALSGMLDKKLKAELQPIKNELQTIGGHPDSGLLWGGWRLPDYGQLCTGEAGPVIPFILEADRFHLHLLPFLMAVRIQKPDDALFSDCVL